jgi:hypothetical protein
MHVSLIDSSRTGMQMMKFSLNHPDRINRPYINFTIGLLKFLIVVFSELATFFYLLTATTYEVIVASYVKIFAIASLDRLTFLTLEAGDPFAKMI